MNDFLSMMEKLFVFAFVAASLVLKQPAMTDGIRMHKEKRILVVLHRVKTG